MTSYTKLPTWTDYQNYLKEWSKITENLVGFLEDMQDQLNDAKEETEDEEEIENILYKLDDVQNLLIKLENAGEAALSERP